MLLPNQMKPIVRRATTEAKPEPSVRAAAASCLSCELLDPGAREICRSICTDA